MSSDADRATGRFLPLHIMWSVCAGVHWYLQTGLIVVALLMVASTSMAQEALGRPPAEICLLVNKNLSLGVSLSRTRARLNAKQPLTVVVIGSSSTVGLWVWNSAATYPHVMVRELGRLLPEAQVELVNSGRIGDTIWGMVRRLQRDVLSHRPDLVVWQLGTNDVTWGGRVDGLKDAIVQAVRALKANGADVILMDLQYAPLVLASSQHATMQTMIAEIAREERIGLFSRFNLMRRSIEAGLAFSALVSFDMLHNSADGYDCIGRALARAISAAAR
jgi:acyl-CoA thioesterase-1